MLKINSNNRVARLAGFLYLLLAITGTFPFYVEKKLIEFGNPLKTVENILASEMLFKGSIVSELIMAIIWVLIAISLYVLFRKVSRNIALLMLSLVLVGGAIVSISVICQVGALIMVKNASGSLAAFNGSQINAMTMFLLNLSLYSTIANFLCMGLWMFPFSYFVIKSEYFPKSIGIIWGILLIAGGLGYLVDFFTFFLLPEYYISVTEFAFAGDLFSLLWLLIKGTSVPDASIT